MKKLLPALFPFLVAACLFSTDQPSVIIPETETSAPTIAAETIRPPEPTVQPLETPFNLPPFPPNPPDTLIMDGFFTDWSAREPIVIDPAGDSGPSGIDFTAVFAAHTGAHLLLNIDLGKEVNLQSEPALRVTLRDADSEISYDFGDRRGRIDGASASQAEIGVISLPTVTSDVFEISFPLDRIADGDLDIRIEDPASGGDAAVFRYSWNTPADPAASYPIERPEGALRIVSWNVLRDNLFDRSLEEHFSRVLQALQPDVILIQEVYIYSEKAALDRIGVWLGGEWFARQQGDLITISRYPFVEDWRDGNYNLRARIFPTMLDVNGTPLVVFNAHLSCCDRDQERQDEVDSFIGFLRQVGLPGGTPFILAGDLNLVGDAQQLATLLTGNIIDENKFGQDFAPDWDGNGLGDLVPRHAFSGFSYTWRDAESSFAPGRLDFVIYTDSVLQARGFVFDTAELPGDVLAAYGLQAEDTGEASDHLPLVADILPVGVPE